MNKSVVLLLSLGLTSALFTVSVAAQQTAKFVDIQRVFQSISTPLEIQRRAAAQFQAETNELGNLERDINFYKEQIRREGPSMAPQKLKAVQDKLVNAEGKYQTLAQSLQQQVQTVTAKQQEALLVLIQDSIEVVAKQEGVDVVLTAEAAVFAPQASDLTDKVAEEYQKTHSADFFNKEINLVTPETESDEQASTEQGN